MFILMTPNDSIYSILLIWYSISQNGGTGKFLHVTLTVFPLFVAEKTEKRDIHVFEGALWGTHEPEMLSKGKWSCKFILLFSLRL